MKFLASLLMLAPAVLGLAVQKRAELETLTDSYMFEITLEQFIVYRDAQNPNTVNWTSDGCTSSPDNPLGFNYVPACNRHDFGYTNFREQSRFTQEAKARIDTNFKTDLYHQCESEVLNNICEALAEVYYAAVVAFGGSDATRRDGGEQEDLVQEYEAKLARYNELIAKAEADGLLASRQADRRQSIEEVSRHWEELDVYD